MNTDYLRTLFAREDVVEAAARAAYSTDREAPDRRIPWDEALPFVTRSYRARVLRGFAAVLELAERERQAEPRLGVACELPVAGGWCQFPIGHEGDCDPCLPNPAPREAS